MKNGIISITLLMFFALVANLIVDVADGTENLERNTLEFVWAAEAQARQMLNPVEKRLLSGLTVADIEKLSDNTGCGLQGAAPYSGRYRTVITARTIYGIPMARFEADCDGVRRR